MSHSPDRGKAVPSIPQGACGHEASMGHALLDFQSQACGFEPASALLLPSGQAQVAQLDESQHLQACLSWRSADQGTAHRAHGGSSFQKKASHLLLPEPLLRERTGLRLARSFYPDVVRGRGDKGWNYWIPPACCFPGGSVVKNPSAMQEMWV